MENGRSLEFAAGSLDDAGAAILSVLEADKQGSERVDECHRFAAQDLQAARARAQAILRRTDERIAKLQVLYLQRIEQRVSELEEASPLRCLFPLRFEQQRVSELEEASPPPSRAADEVMPIAEAVERLAAHLTS
jgi:hypothetical protein